MKLSDSLARFILKILVNLECPYGNVCISSFNVKRLSSNNDKAFLFVWKENILCFSLSPPCNKPVPARIVHHK